MLKLIFATFAVILHITCSTQIQGSESCSEDWHPYKDEKCFKFIDETVSFDDAIKACRKIDPSASLITIRDQEEQDFIRKYIFKIKGVADDIWIGLKHSETWDENQNPMFKWIDGTNYTYQNWAKEMPTNESDRLCTKMKSPYSPYQQISSNNWYNIRCNRRNLIVCQRSFKTWSIEALQNILSEIMKKNEEKFEALNKELWTVKSNPVPIGFSYVQLPSQPEPKILWPIVEWKDVTSQYAGLFFRAEGRDSAAFGIEQNENLEIESRLDVINKVNNRCSKTDGITVSSRGGLWSGFILTGDRLTYGSNRDTCLNFLLTTKKGSGEMRPRNKAIRIWKRTK